ncbi:cell division protein ZipA C-terminal FtsZ-binding domain-containing protein [Algiphilus sp.]|uniref:cell division protein ZipA C-terminal FtsZ-binding domain-containing protein n=1 Tax=Algiphilus sp. TaxID=1872431 RepID=UPI003B5199EC
MTALQLSLLILALVVIAAVGFVSYRRSEAPRSAHRKAPRVDGREEQLDLLGEGSAAGRFDEFGVGEPRRAGGYSASPQPTPSAAAPASQEEEKIVSLFVLQREGQPIPGTTIHRQLHALGLEPGERLTYERRVGGVTWFHVANMRKPGVLDPGEADQFETPGLSLFALLNSADDPVVAFDDLVETAQRLAQSLDAVVLDGQRRPLESSGITELREDVRDWHAKRA